jgi:uncharacterized YccA/Bax inhibitor family protein
MALRTANPALSSKTFQQYGSFAAGREAVMTVQGTVNKTGLLVVFAMASAAYAWNTPGSWSLWMPLGVIGGLVMALVTVFKKEWAGFTAPAYAILEGLFLGAVSALFEQQYAGIVINAVSLTFGTLFMLLILYKTGIIKVTRNFRLGVAAATGAIALVYLLSFVMSFFGARMPFIHSNGLIGIGISLVIVAVAALNLVLDFDFIERGADQGAPKFMEWYAAFGLMVTLVWLYLEILRLLSKLQSRR